MRAELLELLDWLGLEMSWRKRVAAREVAMVTLERFPSSEIHRLPKAERPNANRAVHLAKVIISRTKE